MIKVTIKFDDEGWHVKCDVPGAGKDDIKGWGYGHAFESFEEAMEVALDEMCKHEGESMILMTRGAAKIAGREIEEYLV